MRIITTILKVCTMVALLLVSLSTYGQEKTTINLIKSEFKKFPASIRTNVNFKKAYRFFISKEYDSTLLYSHHFLNSQTEENVYSKHCRYFRGISFVEKQLYSEARKEFERLPNSFFLYHSAQLKLGGIALELEEFSKALKYFLELMELPENQLRNFKQDIILHDIGICYMYLERFEESEEYLLKSLKLQEKKQDTSLIAGTYMDIANLYYEQYKDDQAIPLFEKAYALSKTTNDFVLKRNAAVSMAAVEENRKNYSKSIDYRKEYEQWKDSINDQNKVWEVAQLEKKFISEKKQKEIELLEKDNSIKKAQLNSFIYSSALLLLLAGTIFYFYLSKRKANGLILAQKSKLDTLNDTKDRLFSVVSHDLRSNVNALDRSNSELNEILELKNFADFAPKLHHNTELTGSIKRLLDNMLNWALLQTEQMYFQQENLSLAAIVNQVTHNYKPLLSSKNIDLSMTIATNVFVYVDIESLKIVLRNVLDNAIKFSNSHDQISIYSRAHSKEYCQLIVEDTGTGMTESTLNKLLKESKSQSNTINQERTGLGLHLCQAMIHKNGGELTIESEEKIGTKLIITVPLSQDYE